MNIDFDTFIPKTESKLDSEDDPAERIDIPFVNPVDLYRNYNLKVIYVDTEKNYQVYEDGFVMRFYIMILFILD